MKARAGVHTTEQFLQIARGIAILLSLIPAAATGAQAGDIPSLKLEFEAAAKAAAKQHQPLVSDDWTVLLRPGQDMQDIAAQLGLQDYRPVGSLENCFTFTLPESRADALRTRARLADMPGIADVRQQVRRQYVKDVVITDPLFGAQWHLDRANTTSFGNPVGSSFPGIDAGVRRAWDLEGVDGSGVTIGIVDDGLQYTHGDFSTPGKYNPSASWDYNSGNADPAPNDLASDSHGTSVAGVAAADDDGARCGVGAAYNATLAGLQLIAAPVSDAQIAAALSHTEAGVPHKTLIDVFNNSWSPPSSGVVHDGAGGFPVSPLANAALVNGVTLGRGGRGVIYVWSGGNGRASNDNSNYQSFSNSRYTIAVAALRASNPAGQFSFYSEPGANILISAPSNNWSGEGIRTSDLTGANGANSGGDSTGDADCTDSFGGTSSAAPLVAGIVALMLDANPDLGWRDVQQILADTAIRNDPTNTDWTINAAKHPVNHNYGFGLVDARAAVSRARFWANVPAAAPLDTGTVTVSRAIPDNDATGVVHAINIGADRTLEHVDVYFSATHTYRGDLRVVLTSPGGTRSVLAAPRVEDPNDNYTAWRFMTVRNWGESSVGTWTLRVTDELAQDTGRFDSWRLVLHGSPRRRPPRPDFDADRTSDVLYHHSDGRLLIWEMDNHARAALRFPTPIATIWSVVGKGDFNGDGTADVLYRHADGSVAIAEIQNSQRSTLRFPGAIGSHWEVRAVGDFNGDGTDDILFRAPSGITAIWGMTGSTRTALTFPGSLSTAWTVRGAGDFNADGTDDILYQHTDGRLLIWEMSNYLRSALRFPASIANTWTVVGVGDFNRDGSDDVLYRKNDGVVAIAEITNSARSALKFPGGIGTQWSVKDTGDYNGDGTADIFFRRTADGVTALWGISHSARKSIHFPGGLSTAWSAR